MILQESIDFILKQAHQQIETNFIERIIIGELFTTVQLSSGYCGMAKTEFNGSLLHGHRTADTQFEPGTLVGSNVIKLLETKENHGFLNVIKLATANAISAEWIAKGNYNLVVNKDPLDLLNVQGKRIAMVGAFCSYIKKLSLQDCTLRILELNENAFDNDGKKYFIPASQSLEVFRNADIAIITGSTLANNTIDSVLANIPANVQIIVVGPSGSIIPDILFYKNVSMIGATRVLNPDKLFTMISEGASGYHLFQCGAAQKICILNESK